MYLGVELKMSSGMFGRDVPCYLRAYGGCHSAMVVGGACESCVGGVAAA